MIVRNRTIVIIISLVIVVAGTVFLIAGLPVLGFQYTFWKMHRILDNTSDRELIERTADLPEVKAFLEKYKNARTFIDTDFHIGVVRAISECDLTGQYCNDVAAHPDVAYLDVRLSLDSGLPDHSIFWCGNDSHRFAIGDDALVQRIRDCS
jgi:hypothetical protein